MTGSFGPWIHVPAMYVLVGSLLFSCSSSASKDLTQIPTGADMPDEDSHSSGLNVDLILPTRPMMRIIMTSCSSLGYSLACARTRQHSSAYVEYLMGSMSRAHIDTLNRGQRRMRGLISLAQILNSGDLRCGHIEHSEECSPLLQRSVRVTLTVGRQKICHRS